MQTDHATRLPPSTDIQTLKETLRTALSNYLNADSSEQRQLSTLKAQLQNAGASLELPSIQSACDALVGAQQEYLQLRRAELAEVLNDISDELELVAKPAVKRKAASRTKRLSTADRQQLLERLRTELAQRPQGATIHEIAGCLGVSLRQSKRLLQTAHAQTHFERQGHARNARYLLKTHHTG